MSYQAWAEKSQENLTVAEWCFENSHFNACVNRLYYAMFQVAFAVLLKNGITPPKDKIGHDWLQANFSRHLIRRRKLFPSKIRSYLSDAQGLREIADYSNRIVSKKLTSQELKKAKEFIKTIVSEITNES